MVVADCSDDDDDDDINDNHIDSNENPDDEILNIC